MELPDDVYLMGYFQCEEYFSPVADLIREELTPKADPLPRTAELIAKAKDSNSVSLHVRRGDYVSDPTANALFGVVNLDYYRRALSHIEDRVPNPKFFVFSDDMEWARQNLELPGQPVFVDHTGPDTSAEDIRLVRACRHNVIANSSFSWWGAWLGEHEEKKVVSPSTWTSDEAEYPRDIIPARWQRM